MGTVVVLNQSHLGHGDADLGARILKTFLQKARAIRDLEAVVLLNSGVKLVTEGSPVLAELTLLEEGGVDLYPCNTCLAHFGLEPAVGEESGMDEIIGVLGEAAKTVTL
jgi:hypothetical protein